MATMRLRNVLILGVLAAAGAVLAGCEGAAVYTEEGYNAAPTPYYPYYGYGVDDYYGPGLYVDPFPNSWPEGFWRDYDRHREWRERGMHERREGERPEGGHEHHRR